MVLLCSFCSAIGGAGAAEGARFQGQQSANAAATAAGPPPPPSFAGPGRSGRRPLRQRRLFNNDADAPETPQRLLELHAVLGGAADVAGQRRSAR